MKLVLVLCVIAFPLALGATTLYNADRHKGYGAECVNCHGDVKPETGAYVEVTACLGCHGSYEDMQKLTAQKFGNYNPHLNHLGEVDCTVCHKGHQESASYCNSCHENLHNLK